MVAAFCEYSVDLYNSVADLKAHKATLDADMEGAFGEVLTDLQESSRHADKII